MPRPVRGAGWTPIEPHYVDNDCSASNGKTRPAYRRMLADIRAGKVDAVVVWDLDRLHRRPIELEEFIDLADAKHLALATVTGEVDLSTHNGRLYARIKGAVARSEMDQKSARQKLAAKQRAEQGEQWWSARPFGFAYQDGRPVLTDGQPTLDPIEADAIRDGYSAVINGRSLYAIVQDWNGRGLLTPRGNRWRGSQVRQLLLAPRNAALRSYRGDENAEEADKVGLIAAAWPAIVPRDTWEGVRDILADPDRTCGKSRARRRLLSNIATCGLCGVGLASGVTSRPRQNPIYLCKACNKVSRNGAALDQLVRDVVVARLSRPDAIELTVPEERDDLDELRDRARALRARLDGLATEFADGDLTASQIKTATKRITEQLAAIDATLIDAQRTHVFDGTIGADDVGAAFDALDLDRRRAIVDTLVSIAVDPTGRRGGRTFDPNSVTLAWK